MARKKEVDLDVRNKAKIAEIAKKLFLKYGYEKTLMNDIAKEADMSKSTLYVYFKSKEEIKNYISLEAMQYFHDELKRKIQPETMDLHTRYMAIYEVLVHFKEKYPLSFQLIVEEICVDDEVLKENKVLAEIYEVGEEINRFIQVCFQGETDESTVTPSIEIMEQWGSIYGIITLADNKTAYLLKNFGVTKEEFLRQSFEDLYWNRSKRK